jgi:thioredoxin-dependent peroxiredoxin
MTNSSLKIGSLAPDFTLEDQNGSKVSLKSFRGKNVVVYFYPRAMTPGCTVQACGIRDAQKKLNDLDIVVLGISPDPAKKLKQFEEKQKLNFLLLSDPDHVVAEKYHSWGLKKFMGKEYMGILRQSFLIDQKGKLIHIMQKVNTKTHHDEVIKIFKDQ